jgi:hypothetical protein
MCVCKYIAMAKAAEGIHIDTMILTYQEASVYTLLICH